MSETSARLALPLLAPGQAQKEMIHNEALALIDLIANGAVEAVGIDVPPGAPGEGQAWIVGIAPVGAWSGHARAVAGWTAGGWRFVAARAGMTVWSIADGMSARFVGGAWTVGEVRGHRLMVDGVQLVGERQGAIPGPAGGTVIDAEARAALSNVLMALREHGLIAP